MNTKLHSEKTLASYNKKQLVYYCQLLEKRCVELEDSFNAQYNFLKNFCSEKKSELNITLSWKNEQDDI